LPIRQRRLRLGLIGLGRLGKVYAGHLSRRVDRAALQAVADTDGNLARRIAQDFDVPAAYAHPSELINDPDVEAIVVVSPTHTHREIVVAALHAGRATFCEKPLALSLNECREIDDAVKQTGTFFQMGFMRRFDPGYAAARKRISSGEIGRPVVFKSTSRDPFPPSVEYANPASSGGILVDMGIHDIDLARWFMGEIETVTTIAGTLVYPELGAVGDFDNAIASLVFADGRLGVIDLTRNGIYGYDISTELLGTEGTIRIGYLRETPIVAMTRNRVAHDTVPYFMERFERAYTLQLQDFVNNVLEQREPPVTIRDGIEALRVALAATRSCRTGQPVKVSTIQ